jgi:hypothetical protein
MIAGSSVLVWGMGEKGPTARSGLRAQSAGRRAQGTGLRAQGSGRRAQGAGHRAHSAERRMPDAISLQRFLYLGYLE